MAFSRQYSKEEALHRLRIACDKRERTHWEVREKLIKWGLFPGDREDIITTLIGENYLNEERYASAFASDKSRFYGWGPRKIKSMLKAKGVSDRNIAHALSCIDTSATAEQMKKLYERQLEKWSSLPAFQRKGKIARFLIGKGYDPSRVWELLGQD